MRSALKGPAPRRAASSKARDSLCACLGDNSLQHLFETRNGAIWGGRLGGAETIYKTRFLEGEICTPHSLLVYYTRVAFLGAWIGWGGARPRRSPFWINKCGALMIGRIDSGQATSHIRQVVVLVLLILEATRFSYHAALSFLLVPLSC